MASKSKVIHETVERKPMYTFFNEPTLDSDDCVNWHAAQQGTLVECTWPELVEHMLEFEQTYEANKPHAHLFAPHRFVGNYRLKRNSIEAYWLFLDVDKDGDVERDAGWFIDRGLEAVIYASPSCSVDDWRYRIMVPLDGVVPAEFYRAAATGLQWALGITVDTSKLGCDSWCFIPGKYGGHSPIFDLIHIEGTTLPAGEWVQCVPANVSVDDSGVVDGVSWEEFQQEVLIAKTPSKTGLELYLDKRKVDEYNAIVGGTGKTQGLFGLMVSTVYRAAIDGYLAGVGEIAQLARHIDTKCGGYHHKKYPRNIGRYETSTAPNVIAAVQQHLRGDNRFTRFVKE